MRRNPELVRKLLLKLEGLPSRPGDMFILNGAEPQLAIEGYTFDQITYHLEQLKEMGLIDSPGAQPMIGVTFRGLSAHGHDFLERDRERSLRERNPEGGVVKRDIVLIRRLLTFLEDTSNNSGFSFEQEEAISLNSSLEQIRYNLKQAEEMGLIEVGSKPLGGEWIVRGLTPRGHDFLDKRQEAPATNPHAAAVDSGGSTLPPPMSLERRRHILAATSILKALGHAGFDRTLLELGVPEDVGSGPGLAARANSLARYLLSNPDAKAVDGSLVGEAVINRARSLFDRGVVGASSNVAPHEQSEYEEAFANDIRDADHRVQLTEQHPQTTTPPRSFRERPVVRYL